MAWHSTVCAVNIVLAILATILATFASFLVSIDTKCLTDIIAENDCSGYIPSCRLEKSLRVTTGFFYAYSLTIGMSSIAMVLNACCNHEEPDKKKLILHGALHAYGCLMAFASIISLIIFHVHITSIASTKDFIDQVILHYTFNAVGETSFDPMHNCLYYFNHSLKKQWNVMTFFSLIICFVLHGLMIAHILLSKYSSIAGMVSAKFSTDNNELPTIKVDGVTQNKFRLEMPPQARRIRIPSTRTYPSSPIIPKPMSPSVF